MTKYAIIENGVVVNVVKASESFATDQGWIETVPGVVSGWIWNGETFLQPEAPPATIEQVIEERTARLAAGFDYDFGDSRGIHHIGTTADDMRGWDEVTTGANAAIALGIGSTEFQIVTDTGPVTLTALEWQSILMAATAFRQPIWGASFVLQSMNPIPYDFASYFP